MHLRVRQLYLQAKDGTVVMFRKLATGISFEEITEMYTKKLIAFLPENRQRFAEYGAAFVLLHLYLLYVIVFCLAKEIVKHTKMKGSKITPYLPDVKEIREQIAVTVLAGMAAMQCLQLVNVSSWFAWALAVRPQINIKPQVKVVSSESCSNTCSHAEGSQSRPKLSVSLQSVKPGITLGVEPKDVMMKTAFKDVQAISDSVTVTKDLFEAVVEDMSPDSLLKHSPAVHVDSSEDFVDANDDFENELIDIGISEDEGTAQSAKERLFSENVESEQKVASGSDNVGAEIGAPLLDMSTNSDNADLLNSHEESHI